MSHVDQPKPLHTPGGNPSGPAAPHVNGHSLGPQGSRDVLHLWRQIRADVTSMGRDAETLARLRWQRVRVAVKEEALGLAFGAWMLLLGVVMTIVAAIYLVVGMVRGVSALADGSQWAGPLAVGSAIVLGGLVAFAVVRRRIELRFCEEIERRFGPAPGPSTGSPPEEAPRAS